MKRKQIDKKREMKMFRAEVAKETGIIGNIINDYALEWAFKHRIDLKRFYRLSQGEIMKDKSYLVLKNLINSSRILQSVSRQLHGK